ncbi:probable cytochrome P450 6d5 [Drosophila tropicalis]|uniref:probable cytochrome P450 6d5 n=1 Tax=Drosophila tropicalis TaxID=46794 RepID=UPI0035ABD041
MPNHMVGHLTLFLIAGFETSASTAAFTLYELTQHPKVMAKAKEDVINALAKHGGKLSYDAIQDMKYLELCIMETARKYPALPILNRECTKDYQLPNSSLTIKKGTPIVISLMGLHRDEQHFPNPMSYEPERFTEEHRNYNPTAYMPFGEGPRQCIGVRMGKVNVKIALAKILSTFNLEPCQEKREIEFTIHGISLMPEDGVPVKVSRKK